ncbi:DUF4097 family beta strand repeat-containing protein [Amycolatopsis sp., V23-08]|uniref:DUF4097 family beta strand repeat-containing protein n=1 Tax=Amycolatopsis heterodermiae TaxID=3110235 RepID=A0ABU5R278_9PSEU|nr:DUF4097 family beta strand repeat-containing protein [Amycolatopsis sp., V23-08]MEA5360308.1 DUF4097 family beta strand repeat-containing protein [Amycolatopsis sp., V23-08]
MQTFATTTPITATLDLPAGRVHLRATDRTDTTVEIRPADPGKTRDVQAAEQTTVTYTDGVLRIHTPQGKIQYFGPSGSIDVTVELPTGSRVEATSTAAELDSTGRLGDVAFTGAYRHITLAHTAAVRLTATDGDVHIGHLDGPADIGTARGDIHIGEATGGTVTLETQTGSITVGAAPGVSATLDAGTTHGRIDNTLKNNGTPELTIRATTTQGDIVARSL